MYEALFSGLAISFMLDTARNAHDELHCSPSLVRVFARPGEGGYRAAHSGGHAAETDERALGPDDGSWPPKQLYPAAPLADAVPPRGATPNGAAERYTPANGTRGAAEVSAPASREAAAVAAATRARTRRRAAPARTAELWPTQDAPTTPAAAGARSLAPLAPPSQAAASSTSAGAASRGQRRARSPNTASAATQPLAPQPASQPYYM